MRKSFLRKQVLIHHRPRRTKDDVVFDTAVDEPFDIQVDDEVDQVSTVATNEFGLLDEEDDAALPLYSVSKELRKKLLAKAKTA